MLPRLALSCATASRLRPKTAGLSQGHSEQLQFAAWEVDNTGRLGSEDGRSVVGAGQLAEHNASLAPAAARVPGNDDIVGISRTGRPTEPGRRKGAGAHRVVPDDGRKAAPVALAEKLYQIQLIPLLGPGRRGQACVAFPVDIKIARPLGLQFWRPCGRSISLSYQRYSLLLSIDECARVG